MLFFRYIRISLKEEQISVMKPLGENIHLDIRDGVTGGVLCVRTPTASRIRLHEAVLGLPLS